MQSAHGKHMGKAYPAEIELYLTGNIASLSEQHCLRERKRITLKPIRKKRRKFALRSSEKAFFRLAEVKYTALGEVYSRSDFLALIVDFALLRRYAAKANTIARFKIRIIVGFAKTKYLAPALVYAYRVNAVIAGASLHAFHRTDIFARLA